eukprot:1560279-Prymnesium_polylepis.1
MVQLRDGLSVWLGVEQNQEQRLLPSHNMPLGMGVHGKVGAEVQNRRRSSQWRQLQLTKERQDAEQVEEWFRRFDVNSTGKLEREELRALCNHVQPEREPTEEALDYLIKKATEIDAFSIKISGNPNGAVSRDAAIATMQRYKEYVYEQQYIDGILQKYGAHKSGHLEFAE